MALTQNLYILGTGPVARFIASQFASRHVPKPTLLFHKDPLFKQYLIAGSQITYENRLSGRHAFRVTHQIPGALKPDPERGIDNLIVTTLEGLSSVGEYLGRSSNVIFVNPALGSTDSIVRGMVQHQKDEMPHIWQMLTTHVLENGPNFDIKHTLSGTAHLSACPRTESFADFIKGQDLLFPNDRPMPEVIKKIFQLPLLNPLYLPYKDVYVLQLERTVISCCLAPLDVLEVTGKAMERTISGVIEECLLVIGNLNRIKTLRQVDATIDAILDKQRLFDIVMELVKGRRAGAVANANRYIVGMAEREGVSTPVNKTLVDLMDTRREMERDAGEVIR